VRSAHAPSNSALVFVPGPQLKYHLKIMFSLIQITPHTPLLRHVATAAPSNHPEMALTIGLIGNLLDFFIFVGGLNYPMTEIDK
jgi:hypothetical protein